jgi:hypothetical protein
MDHRKPFHGDIYWEWTDLDLVAEHDYKKDIIPTEEIIIPTDGDETSDQ